MERHMTTIDPQLLGFWGRCIRETSHWSQEALAEAAQVDTRTVQRFEAGKRVSITTQRAIARGLGYEDSNVFEDPKFISTVEDFFARTRKLQKDEFDAKFPDRARVKVERVTSGETLRRLADVSNGLLCHADENISREAKESAAALFDHLTDLLDLDDISFADKLIIDDSLEVALREVEKLGVAVFSGRRDTRIVGENWTDKTPLRFTAGYLFAVPAEQVLTEMLVSRRLS
jgi:transcriptional regulator with XRE-family HTH domain